MICLTVLSFHARMTADIITVMQHSEFPSLKEFETCVNHLPWAEGRAAFSCTVIVQSMPNPRIHLLCELEATRLQRSSNFDILASDIFMFGHYLEAAVDFI